ncbi:CDT1-like protein b [Zingiber officinale]|uniref:CDT1 Geminin-binding domain-containing protein n=1 Tax=Zingiber officinale TaxID=94328 RepID=A0A8J5GDQ2_ZINOF|nr:CDT1-like protein b [Zingiber officinale]KAG6504061.1 hypothetical protein ZIOFF_036387 [Zingiber officinale]
MEHEGCMEKTSESSGCRKILYENDSDIASDLPVKIDQKEEVENNFVSPTPQKPEWSNKDRAVASLTRKQLANDFENEGFTELGTVVDGQKDNEPDKLPDNYHVLAELFNRLDTAIRLLRLRKLSPTFRNISPRVEILTKRKFLYNHLAQMIFIFPEAIKIEKILVHDKETLVVIPDINVTLLKDVVEDNLHPNESISVALCEAFRKRLFKFFITHPEDIDIPKAMLPEPFNQSNCNLPLETLPKNCITEPQPPESSLELDELLGDSLLPLSFGRQILRNIFSPGSVIEHRELASASVLPSSFKRHFSQKVIIPESKKTQLLATQPLSHFTSNMEANSSISGTKSLACLVSSQKGCSSSYLDNTPLKGASSCIDAMTAATPVLQTPKRPVPTPNEKLTIEDDDLVSESKLSTSARRSLKYSSTDIEANSNDTNYDPNQQCMVLKSSSDQIDSAKRLLWEQETDKPSGRLPCMVHHLTAANSKDNTLNLMGERKKSSRMFSSVLATFDAISFNSQSKYYFNITKEELVHKILSNNLELEDPREAEEHLSLLERLLPDWISKKFAFDGQQLYSFKQTADRESFRTRVVEAEAA